MRALGMVAAASVLLVLTGCGGDGEARVGGAESSGAPAPPSAPASSPGAPSEPGDPAGASSEPSLDGPRVAPADGPMLSSRNRVSIRVPRSFQDGQVSTGGTVTSAERQSDLASVLLSSRLIIGEPDFDQLKRIARQGRSTAPNFRVLPDIVWAGQPAFHFVSDHRLHEDR